jgi:ankyrin repeat protein
MNRPDIEIISHITPKNSQESSIWVNKERIGEDWSGFRLIIFTVSWEINLDKVYQAYNENDLPQMRRDIEELPTDVYAIVATSDATCNYDGSNRNDAKESMKILNAKKFLSIYGKDAPSSMRLAYCAVLRKGHEPILEEALPQYGGSVKLHLPASTTTDESDDEVPQINSEFPLHDALMYGRYDLAMQIILCYPEEVSKKESKNSQIPLHWAMFNKSTPKEIIMELLSIFPGGAAIPHWNGFYAIHFAAKDDKPVEILEALITAYPESVYVKNKSGKLPIDLALENAAAEQVLLALISADLPVEFNKDLGVTTQKAVDKHGYSWAIAIDYLSSAGKTDICVLIVKEIFRRVPRCIRDLIFSKDDKGRTIRSIAHEKVRIIMNQYLFFFGRYDISSGLPIHRSATSIVMSANDYLIDGSKALVAMKFMRNRDQFLREVRMRERFDLDDKYVLGIYA